MKNLVPICLATFRRSPRTTSSSDLRWERGVRVLWRGDVDEGLNDVPARNPSTPSMFGYRAGGSPARRRMIRHHCVEPKCPGVLMKQKAAAASVARQKPLGIFGTAPR